MSPEELDAKIVWYKAYFLAAVHSRSHARAADAAAILAELRNMRGEG